MVELNEILSNLPTGAKLTLSGVGGAIVGGGLVAIASRRKKRNKARNSRKRNHKYRKTRKQRKPYTAGKRKDTSHRRIRFTKRGQPYIIMGNGRARFISNKSAKASRRRKGGRY